MEKHRRIVGDFSGGVNGIFDEKLTSLAYSVKSFNFNNFDGTLKDGKGLSVLKNGNNGLCLSASGDVYALNIYYFGCGGEDLLLLYCSDGYVYRYGKGYDTLAQKITDLHFSKQPSGVGYNYGGQDVYLFSGEEGVFCYDGEQVTSVNFPDGVRDIKIYNERLYLVSDSQPNRLWYSDDFDPFNFSVSLTEGGYIDVADNLGEIRKLASYGGHLYLFRMYGISRFTGYYDQSEFLVENLFCSTGQIYPNSVTVCGDGVIFLAADGLYRVYGYKVKKILSCYDKYLGKADNVKAKGVYSDGFFYLNCKMDFDGGEQDVLIICRLSDYSSYLGKGMRIRDMATMLSEDKGGVALIIENSRHVYTFSDTCVLDGVPLIKNWKSPFTDFGKTGIKSVSKVFFYLKGSVELCVESDYGRKKVLLRSKGGQVSETIGLKGNRFSFDFLSKVPDVEISALTIEYVTAG